MVVSTNQDVQTALNQLGYRGADGNPLKVDGIIGTNSIFAVKAFQTDHSLSVDGKPGPVTKAALTAALANAGEPQAVAAVAQDNTQGPTVAMHLPAVADTPAMTVHVTTAPSGATSTVVKPFGTPASATSALALLTGASPKKAAPLAVKTASMTTGTKAAIAAAIVAAGIAAKKFLGKGKAI